MPENQLLPEAQDMPSAVVSVNIDQPIQDNSPQPARTPRHIAARAYAEAGVPVFPCVPNEKTPATPHSFKDATTDLAQIDRWWSTADYNIGLEPDRLGMAVIDVDVLAGGDPTPYPPTFTVRTPSGGSHLYYAGEAPPSVRKIAPGIDTRGRGGYVLLPPSHVVERAKGYQGAYIFPEGASALPEAWELPSLPDHVVAALNTATAEPRQAPADVEIDKPLAIEEAKRFVALDVQTNGSPVEGAGSDDRAYRIASRLKDFGLSPEKSLEILAEDWAPHFDGDWLQEKIDDAHRYGQNEPGSDVPLSGAEKFGVIAIEHAGADGGQKTNRQDDDEVELICGADVDPEEIDWLWRGHYALGKFHLLAGKPEAGKNLLCINTAAVLSVGAAWPDDTTAPVGDTIIWSGEDAFRDTTLPRFLAAGGDPRRFHCVRDVMTTSGEKRPFDPAKDVARLCRAAAKLPDLRYIIIDPVSVVVAGGRGSSNNNAETRRALQPLVDLAEQRKLVVEGITHFAKGSEKRDVLERVIESTAFTAVARLVHVAHRFEDDARSRRWVRIKGSILKRGASVVVGYEYDPIEVVVPGFEHIRAPRLKWGETLCGEGRALIQEEPDVSQLSEAMDFILGTLRQHHNKMDVKALRAAADAHGISLITLKRAKNKLGARVVAQQNLGATHDGWNWHLTEAEQPYQNGEEIEY